MSTSTAIRGVPFHARLADAKVQALDYLLDIINDPDEPARERRLAATAILRFAASTEPKPKCAPEPKSEPGPAAPPTPGPVAHHTAERPAAPDTDSDDAPRVHTGLAADAPASPSDALAQSLNPGTPPDPHAGPQPLHIPDPAPALDPAPTHGSAHASDTTPPTDLCPEVILEVVPPRRFRFGYE
jgi:hypothetical protein